MYTHYYNFIAFFATLFIPLIIFYIAIRRLRSTDGTIPALFRKLSAIGWSIIGMMIILCLGLSHIFDDLIKYLLSNHHFLRNNYLPYYFLLSGIIIAVFAVAFPKKEKSIITFSILCFALSAIMKVLSLADSNYYL
jgi:hypothetical protein